MAVSMYRASVPGFLQLLGSLAVARNHRVSRLPIAGRCDG